MKDEVSHVSQRKVTYFDSNNWISWLGIHNSFWLRFNVAHIELISKRWYRLEMVSWKWRCALNARSDFYNLTSIFSICFKLQLFFYFRPTWYTKTKMNKEEIVTMNDSYFKEHDCLWKGKALNSGSHWMMIFSFRISLDIRKVMLGSGHQSWIPQKYREHAQFHHHVEWA